MERMPFIFGLLFFAASCIYLTWIIYIIKTNSKGRTNKIFMIVSLYAAIWSLGYSVTSLATEIDSALFGIRLANLGKILFISGVLHLILLVANKTAIAKQRRIHFYIYIPALIYIYIFVISRNLAIAQYSMVETNFGWINMAANNTWDILLCLYQFTYAFFIMRVAWRCRLEIKKKSKSKQVDFLFLSLMSVIVLRVISYILSNQYLIFLCLI